MERPNGPLPPIPVQTSPIDSLETIAKTLEDVMSPFKTSPPPPAIQPNESVVGMGTKSISDRCSLTGTTAILPSKPPNPASLASSAESFGVSYSLNDEQSFSMNPIDYKIGSAIGFGSSAIVYHATYLPLGVIVAVKMIDLDHFERNQIDELRREIQIMTLCKHPNLLRILASFVHESKLWIVTPYLSGGSCLDIMKTGYRDGLEESIIATILHQALQGLEYLHRNGHIHRDFKAGNLLMDRDGGVQLADFGVSSCLSEDVDRRGIRKTFVGTPCWMAPEVMEMTKGYDCKADIWSFGITALELAYGHAPFSKYPPMKVIYLTLSNAPPTLDRKKSKHKYNRAFKELIDSCLQRDPTKRPSAETLLRHPFFKAAKKKSFLVNELLSKIPSLEERPRVKKLIKQIAGRLDDQQDTPTKGNDEWDFSSASDTDVSTAPTSPVADVLYETSNAGTVIRCSRFVVEAEPASSQAESQTSPGEPSLAGIEKTPSDVTADAVYEEESGVRKGRFSVLESATGEVSSSLPSDPPNQSSSIGPSPPPPEESEEGRRSRFKVESINDYSVNRVTNAKTEQMSARDSPLAPQSRFEVSNRLPSVPSGTGVIPPSSSYPSYAHNNYGSQPLPEDIMIGEDYYRMTCEYGRPPTSHGPLIFVHPSQFDQLLLLNELVKQQLMELKNTATYRSRIESSATYNPSSSSLHPIIQGNNAFHYGRTPMFWDGLDRVPMADDPRGVCPSAISAYSPHLYDQPRSLDYPNYPKRRSFSIDNRQPSNSQHINPSRNQSGIVQSLDNCQHRSVHSLKSPNYLPSDVEILRRELELLKRENEQLKKQP